MEVEMPYIDEQQLRDFILFLADSSLIMGHRLSEWTGHGPMLEQDIAITNIALDLIGQSRNFYQYAAQITKCDGKEITEDDLAYLRDAHQFRNLLITELPNGDWAKTIGKIFFVSTWQFFFYELAGNAADETLSAIALKSLKESTYHKKWSSNWVIRLGDGTKESHARMETAIDELWPYTGEMFKQDPFAEILQKRLYIDVSNVHAAWLQSVTAVMEEATLSVPHEDVWMQSGGKKGVHTEHLGYILAEMQFLQRAYPGLKW